MRRGRLPTLRCHMSAKIIQEHARISRNAALRISRNEAALRVYDDTCCASLAPPFCASDVRLLSPGDDTDDWPVVYDCRCASCDAARVTPTENEREPQ